MNKLKILNDPIYGFITIPNVLIYDLIEHPYFQRLRRISQMGLSHLVFIHFKCTLVASDFSLATSSILASRLLRPSPSTITSIISASITFISTSDP